MTPPKQPTTGTVARNGVCTRYREPAEHRSAALLLGALCAVLYFGGMGNAPFYSWREAREALVVQEELRSGNWILPLRNGNELPSKPPLFHWLGGLAALARGVVDPFAVRFPSALLATFAVLVVFANATRKWGTEAGIAAAVVLATNVEWLGAATSARVDMTQAALLTTAFLALESATRASQPGHSTLAALYVSMGLATLAKGPTGILLPILVAAVDLACRRDTAGFRRLRPIVGLAGALAIPGVWYAFAAAQGGEPFVRKQLLVENVGRFLDPESFEVPHVHPVYHYVPAFLGGFAPWSVLLIPLGIHLYRNRRRLEAAGELFPLVWFAVVFVFFSLARGKRPVYLLSIYPAAALLVGRWWSEVVARRSGLPPALARTLRIGAAAAGIAVLGLLVIVLAERFGADPSEAIRPLVEPKALAEIDVLREIVTERFFGLVGWALAAAMAVGAFYSSIDPRRWHRALSSFTLLVVCAAMLANVFYIPAVAERRSYESFFREVGGIVAPSDRLFFHRSFDYGAVFYAGRHVRKLAGEPCGVVEPGRRAYALMWEREWQKLDPLERGRWTRIAVSAGTGPRGRDPLVLAELSAAGCG